MIRLDNIPWKVMDFMIGIISATKAMVPVVEFFEQVMRLVS